MTSYDPDNIFAKILRGELPAYKVYEDDKTLAFLDIMPRAPGHTLVIPKAPARNVFDIAEEDFLNVARTTRRIARVAVDVFKADGVTLQQLNGKAGGQFVFHLHMHIMPRFDGVALRPGMSHKEDPETLKDHQARLSAAIKAAG